MGERGKFLTFEGGDGAGKSTCVRRLVEDLRSQGFDVVVTREPGGTPLAETVRGMLLRGDASRFGAEQEVAYFSIARADHVEKVIRPAIEAGRIVISDRFFDSTRAYQGGHVDARLLDEMERIAVGPFRPHATFIFDIDPVIGIGRVSRRSGDAPDAFEGRHLDAHVERRVRYLDIAAREPGRCRVVNASRTPDEVFADVRQQVLDLLSA